MSLGPHTLVAESVPAFTRSTDWLEETYTNGDSRFIEIGDARIHYRSEGNEDNQTLVLVHGSFSSLQVWDGWVEQLEDEYHLVRLDMPGFGLTGPRKEGEHTLEYLVRVVGAFCDRLELEDIILVGNSLGGGVAWRVATERPDLVSGTILIDAGGGTLLCRIIDSLSTPFFAQLWVPRLVTRLFISDAYGGGRGPDTETVKRYHDMLLRKGNRRAIREFSRNFRRDHPEGCGLRSVFPTPPSLREPNPDVCGHYSMSDITTPVLFQWGEGDRWLPLSFGKQLADRVPHSTFISYADLGHVPMEEAPVETANDAREFIEQVRADEVIPQIDADDIKGQVPADD